MAAENDKPGGKPGASRTVVGVPILPEAPLPVADDEQPTALAVKTVSPGEAERVLTGAPPTVAGAVSPRPPAVNRTPGLAGDLFKGIGPSFDTMRPTRAGVAPQPGTATRGRSTLLLDGSAPPLAPPNESADAPPIVVPASGVPVPKSVTQPPPWGEGAARIGPAVPAPSAAPRPPAPSVEEISSSMLLPPDATGETHASAVEELSGSLLLEEPQADGRPVLASPAPATRSAPPRVPSKAPAPPVPGTPSRPPVRGAPSRPPAPATPAKPLRTLLGMPNLPPATPAPNLNALAPLRAAAGAEAAPGAPSALTPPPEGPLPPDLAETVVRVDTAPLPLTEAGLLAPPGAPPTQPIQDALPGMSAAPSPPPAPETGDVEVTRLPARPLEVLRDHARRLADRVVALLPEHTALRSGSRPKWFLPVVAVAGLAVAIGALGLLVSVVRAISSSGARERPVPSAAASAPTSAPSALPSPAPAPAAGAPESLAPCAVAGAPHVIGPSATVAAGVEVLLAGSDLGVGFAASDHDAVAVRLDATSLAVTTTAKTRSRDAIRRVTPFVTQKGSLSLLVDADRKGDRLAGRRTLRSSPAVQLGATAEGVSWAHVDGPPVATLWPLSAGGPVDALRGATDSADASTMALTFRRDSAVWMGALDASHDLAAKGELSHLGGLGPTVGSPTIAVSGGNVMVAWADRPSPETAWNVRWTRFAAGGAPADARMFAAPAGGKGEPFMSPALAAAPGGRFLLVWTEGPTSGHVVRALTLAPDGAPVGAPLELSAEGANAGQGQAAISESGAGVVAFLQSGEKGFEVAATSIRCGHP